MKYLFTRKATLETAMVNKNDRFQTLCMIDAVLDFVLSKNACDLCDWLNLGISLVITADCAA